MDLQRITWTDYKLTLKVLVRVAPNSSVVFVSKPYGGSISDKEITNRSGYLDLVPIYSQIMYDKDSNCMKERMQRKWHWVIYKKGFVNLRILVEQVIRGIKTYTILACEYPVTMLKLFDNSVVLCAALSNYLVGYFYFLAREAAS